MVSLLCVREVARVVDAVRWVVCVVHGMVNWRIVSICRRMVLLVD